jgi:hypothetical protein
MFVRWLCRKRKHGGVATHMAALLISSSRNKDRHRHHQKHLAYLGGITREDARDNSTARAAFWATALNKLDGLKLPADERAKIEEQLAARVPRPTLAQLRLHRQRMRQQAQQRVRDLELALKNAKRELVAI